MMRRWSAARAAGALAAIMFSSAGVSPAGAADTVGPPSTHRFVSVLPPGLLSSTAWLISAKADRRGGPSRSEALIALTREGAFFAIEIKDTRLRAKRIFLSHTISALVPPAPLGGGSFAGAGPGGPGSPGCGLVIVSLPGREGARVRASAPLSPLSRPVALNPSTLAAVGRGGSVMIFEKRGGAWRETHRVRAGAIPDAILAAGDMDGDGRRELIVPAAPSGRYAHGVLGDAIEPTEIRAYAFKKGGRFELLSAYAAAGEGAFEALGALTADLDGDEREKILVTRSDDEGGAAHLALELKSGKLVLKATGSAIGMGNRWSHLLGAFDLEPPGGPVPLGRHILAIETPHLAGYLLALDMAGGRLRERARRPGFTTHAIGSRNLWMFAPLRRAGETEIVLQEVGGRRLSALGLQKGGGGWEYRWRLPLKSPVASNIAAGDFNGDGKDDLAWADERGRISAILSR